MIRIILLGRTGNILFQYALGRVLAAKHGVPLVLDGSWYNSAGWSEISHLLKLPLQAHVVRRLSLATRALRRVTGKHYWECRGVPVLRENPVDQSFAPRFLDAPADCVLFGYFQSPLYFVNLAYELRSEINGLIGATLNPIPGQDARATVARASCPQPIIQKLTHPNSVAVHVRRGDYLAHAAFRVCDEPYFRDSMNRMRALVPEARFFIFSDDPSWCRQTFNAPDMEIVDSGAAGHNPLHDLRMMSLASHHIISNSTYSWWAAWLGEKPGQRVVMPGRWFARDIHAPIDEKRMPHWETLNPGAD